MRTLHEKYTLTLRTCLARGELPPLSHRVRSREGSWEQGQRKAQTGWQSPLASSEPQGWSTAAEEDSRGGQQRRALSQPGRYREHQSGLGLRKSGF